MWKWFKKAEVPVSSSYMLSNWELPCYHRRTSDPEFERFVKAFISRHDSLVAQLEKRVASVDGIVRMIDAKTSGVPLKKARVKKNGKKWRVAALVLFLGISGTAQAQSIYNPSGVNIYNPSAPPPVGGPVVNPPVDVVGR